ncbi:MAG: hypothetical protein ACOCQQ_03320 [Candidatus Nanoarchaeia archaeon]
MSFTKNYLKRNHLVYSCPSLPKSNLDTLPRLSLRELVLRTPYDTLVFLPNKGNSLSRVVDWLDKFRLYDVIPISPTFSSNEACLLRKLENNNVISASSDIDASSHRCLIKGVNYDLTQVFAYKTSIGFKPFTLCFLDTNHEHL